MAVERPVGPEASAPFSSSTTPRTPCWLRWKATLAPVQPPPTTTTSAVSVTRRMLARRAGSRQGREARTRLTLRPPVLRIVRLLVPPAGHGLAHTGVDRADDRHHGV